MEIFRWTFNHIAKGLIAQNQHFYIDTKMEGEEMEGCEWCRDEIEDLSFPAIMDGSDRTFCHTCFSLFVNCEFNELIERRNGPIEPNSLH
jgi:hypothetical protein